MMITFVDWVNFGLVAGCLLSANDRCKGESWKILREIAGKWKPQMAYLRWSLAWLTLQLGLHCRAMVGVFLELETESIVQRKTGVSSVAGRT